MYSAGLCRKSSKSNLSWVYKRARNSLNRILFTFLIAISDRKAGMNLPQLSAVVSSRQSMANYTDETAASINYHKWWISLYTEAARKRISRTLQNIQSGIKLSKSLPIIFRISFAPTNEIIRF